MTWSTAIGAVFLWSTAAVAAAGPTDPITGEDYLTLQSSQDTAFQRYLETLFPESKGFLITGPVNPHISGQIEKRIEKLIAQEEMRHDDDLTTDLQRAHRIFSSIRVICPDWPMLQTALERCGEQGSIRLTDTCLNSLCHGHPYGYRGAIALVDWQGEQRFVQFNTVHQTRWHIWYQALASNPMMHQSDWVFRGILRGQSYSGLVRYSIAVSNHLHFFDRGELHAEEPLARVFDIPVAFDLYASPPMNVIEGKPSFRDLLRRYSGIEADFGHGLPELVLTDSLLDVFIERAPQTAWPNKKTAILQSEYRKFMERGGDVRLIQTLTRDGFDTLGTGEYLFAVGLSGKIRTARALPAAEASGKEDRTALRTPAVSHAFLFPGEPVLTAGEFSIVRDSIPHLVEVDAYSEHYFYSNITPTIREDIAARSNEYLLTLGHFFQGLDRLGIPCSNVLIRKFRP